jgi:hypothetical protein
MEPVVGTLKLLYRTCKGNLKFELPPAAILKMAPVVVGILKVL